MSKTGKLVDELVSSSFVQFLGGILALFAFYALLTYTGLIGEEDKDPISVEDGRWSCVLQNSNSFGTCLGHLADELDVDVVPAALDTSYACLYARTHSAGRIWIEKAEEARIPSWGKALERAEYEAQRAPDGKYLDYKEVSPAKKVLESIGVAYREDFWGLDTLEADLQQLKENDEAQKVLGDYISGLKVEKPVVELFWVEKPQEGFSRTILTQVNITDTASIEVGPEGFKDSLIEAENLTPIQCPNL